MEPKREKKRSCTVTEVEVEYGRKGCKERKMRSKGENEGKRGIIEETQEEAEEVLGEKRRRVWCSKTRRIMGLHSERERERTSEVAVTSLTHM